MSKTFSSRKKRSSSIWKYSTHSTIYDLHLLDTSLYDRTNYPSVTQDEKSFCPPSATSSTSSWWWNVGRLKELDAKMFSFDETILFLYSVLMKTRREITTTRQGEQVWGQCSNPYSLWCCLREENMNMQHIEVTVAPYDYWMKCHLIVDENEKWFGGKKYWWGRIFEKLL